MFAHIDALCNQPADAVPPFVVAVADASGEIYVHATPGAHPDSVFWICSQTKMVAHLAALHLIDQQKLHRDTLVADILPQLANPVVVSDVTAADFTYVPAKTPIRVKHLLNFSSGMFYPARKERQYNLAYAYAAPQSPERPNEEFIDILIGDLPGVPLKFEPGTDFVYGFDSDILGFIVEAIAKCSLDEYCKKHFFGPLGMKSSFYLTADLKKDLVPLTFCKGGKLVPWANQTAIIERDPAKVFRCMGGVGLYSTMRDYLKLLTHLLQIRLGTAENPIVSKAVVDTFFVPTLTEAGAKSLQTFNQDTAGGAAQWGTAMALTTQDTPDGRRKKGSVFWSGWATSYGFIDPDTGIAAVFGSQTIPPHHPAVHERWVAVEKALYTALGK